MSTALPPGGSPLPLPGGPADAAQRHLRAGTLQLTELPPLSLYVHLPWCIRKCPYCDFNSHEWPAGAAAGGLAPVALHRTTGGGSPAWQEAASPAPAGHAASPSTLPEAEYVQALLQDLEAALPLVWGRPVVSVFIGGGTPSLFAPAQIDALLAGIRARLRLLPEAEITLEANPGTFERDRFAAYRRAGVTRLSVGVQSFSDLHLRAIGRVHDAAQARAAVEEAARSFDTFNLDLMYALPGQSMGDLQADVQQALAFSPPHLSVYHLTLEPNTYFAKYPPPLPDDDTAYAMLDTLTAATAAAGLQRYEVSAYAREGHRCRHYLNYWQFGDYLGIGTGAHSKLSFAHRVVRQVRLRDPRLYLQRAAAHETLVAQDDEVARRDLPFEFMLNALRLRDGFSLAEFTQRTGLPVTVLAAGLERGEQLGLLQRDLHRVWPSERGFDFLSDLQALFLPG